MPSRITYIVQEQLGLKVDNNVTKLDFLGWHDSGEKQNTESPKITQMC